MNVVAREHLFVGTKLRGLAEVAGLELWSDGCFHARDELGNSLFVLSNLEPNLFVGEDMRTLTTQGVTLMLDVPRVAAIAARAGAKFVVDATFSTPMAMRPLQHGVDVVVHSCTKYLNGHSDLVAGAAACSKALLDAFWPPVLAYGGSLGIHPKCTVDPSFSCAGVAGAY